MKYKFCLFFKDEAIEDESVIFKADTMGQAIEMGIAMINKHKDKDKLYNHLIKALPMDLEDIYDIALNERIVILTPKIFDRMLNVICDAQSPVDKIEGDDSARKYSFVFKDVVVYFHMFKNPRNNYYAYFTFDKDDRMDFLRVKIYIRKSENEFYSKIGYFINDDSGSWNCGDSFKLKEFFFR